MCKIHRTVTGITGGLIDTHLIVAFRAKEGGRFPNPLDEFTPLGRGDTAGLMLRHIDDLDGLAGGFSDLIPA